MALHLATHPKMWWSLGATKLLVNRHGSRHKREAIAKRSSTVGVWHTMFFLMENLYLCTVAQGMTLGFQACPWTLPFHWPSETYQGETSRRSNGVPPASWKALRFGIASPHKLTAAASLWEDAPVQLKMSPFFGSISILHMLYTILMRNIKKHLESLWYLVHPCALILVDATTGPSEKPRIFSANCCAILASTVRFPSAQDVWLNSWDQDHTRLHVLPSTSGATCESNMQIIGSPDCDFQLSQLSFPEK